MRKTTPIFRVFLRTGKFRNKKQEFSCNPDCESRLKKEETIEKTENKEEKENSEE